MTDLRIGDDIFNVMVEGDVTKPPLLLSHSLGTDLSMWDAQVPALLEHFRVVRYDTRGHGGSAKTDAAVSIARLGRDALAILDALEIDRAHFIGLSMGGVIGQWLLLNAPERVDRVVLANTAAKLGDADGWNRRIVGMLSGETDAAADATMARWFSAAYVEAAPERVAAIDRVLRATDPRGYVACCAALRDVDLRQALLDRPAIADAPVLVISGTDDPVIAESDTAFLTQAFANAQHVALEARHISNIEADAAFTAAVVEFLAAKPARRKAPTAARATKPTPTTRRPPKTRSTAARVPLKRTAGPVVPAATTTAKPTAPRKAAGHPASRAAAAAAAAKPAATRSKATKAVIAPTTRKANAPSKPARAGTTKASRAPARTAVGKAPAAKTSTAKTSATKSSATKSSAIKKTAPTRTKASKTASPKATTVKKVATKPATTKSIATKPVSSRRKPATVGARGTVTTRSPAKAAAKTTTQSRTAKAKPASAKAAAGRTAASKKAASKPTASKAAGGKRGVASIARPKAKAIPKTAGKQASTPVKAPVARRKPAAAKPGRPTGRRKP